MSRDISDAQRIYKLEEYVKEIAGKIEEALEVEGEDRRVALQDILNDVRCTSDGTWGNIKFITGPYR